MTETSTNHAYYALRVSTTAVSPEWWAAAHADGRRAPLAVRALLGGRTRVELTAEEAVLAIHWAARLSGWGNDGEHPLVVYPPLAVER